MADKGRRIYRTRVPVPDPNNKPREVPSRISQLVSNGLERASNIPKIARFIPDEEEFYPDDKPYLEQYMNPDKDLLPRNTDRPRSLTINPRDSAAWRKFPKSYPDSSIQPIRDERGFKLEPERLYEIRNGQAVPIVASLDGPDTLAGLGNHRTSLGRDEQGPYMSMYDKWDFDSPNVNFFTKGIMERIGKPFHVYERMNITPTNKRGEYRIQRRKPK